MTKRKAAIVTKTADAIVTVLSEGPSSARDLSQRLDGIEYANIRQTLARLAKAGIVTKLARGLYAVHCDSPDCDTPDAPDCDKPKEAPAILSKCNAAAGCDNADCAPAIHERPLVLPCDDDMRRAIATTWADFEAMNNPSDPRAWL